MDRNDLSRREWLSRSLVAGGMFASVASLSGPASAAEQAVKGQSGKEAASGGASGPAVLTDKQAAERKFFNPLVDDGADPWISYHDGSYYFTCTGSREIRVRRAASLGDLGSARERVVWQDNTPSRNSQFWAPEFHLVDGPNGKRWYLYYCASDGWHLNHRCHVLESTGDTPLGPYVYKGQLRTDPDNKLFAIDATLLTTSTGKLYTLWAGHPGHRIFISEMSNPWTTRGRRARLAADGFGCEEVREGPVMLVRNGKVFLIYSICDTGKPDYKLGMLIADEKADLLRPESWKQYPTPVFTRNDDAGVYGPGHNGFFKSPDGKEDWIIYHAKSTPMYTYRARTPRAQRFTWRADGMPNFGEPLPLSAVIALPSGDPGSSDRPGFFENNAPQQEK